MKGITAVMSNKALVVIDMELRLTNVPYEQMHDFALDRSFDLDAEQYDRFMLRAHEPEILLSYDAPTGRAFAGSLPVSEKETCSKNFNILPIMAVQRKGAPCACGLLEIPLAENKIWNYQAKHRRRLYV